jgi:uncharacterized protein
MASAAYEQLLKVQDLDVTLTQLHHRLATHPLRAEQAGARAELAEISHRRDEAAGRQHELDRELRKLSDEVAVIEDKRAKNEAKLYDGSVTATKELLALQDEGKSLLDRQRRIEDGELELMERLEEVGAEVAGFTAEVTELEERISAIDRSLSEATAGLEAEIEQAVRARAEAVAPVGADLLARYKSLGPEFDGAPLARFVSGRCDGCHMQLSAMAVDRLNKTPGDQPVTCEECGRLLVR